MPQTASAPARPTLSARPGASRKLLQRKAERAGPAAPEPTVEDAFPAAETPAPGEASDAVAGDTIAADRPEPPAAPEPSGVAPAEPESAPLDAAAPAPAHAPAAAPAWSSEDESALQAMLARRKAAGFQRRGRDVSAQLIRPGAIKPNDGTVVALIVGIVAERGVVARGALLDLIAATAFPYAKARPSDRGWCQGYVAGALRDGFLALADGGDNTAAVQA